MKIAIAFCVLAFAAAANDAVADGSHMQTIPADDWAVCGNPDSPQATQVHYKFDSANNWVGDHGASPDRTDNIRVVTTYANGQVEEIGHREKMTETKTTTTTWTTQQCSGYKRHSRCDTGCNYWFGTQCQEKQDCRQCVKRTWYGKCRKYKTIRNGCHKRMHWCPQDCTTKQHSKTDTTTKDYIAGYCNIASYNGENMWVVAGSAANNEYSASRSDFESGDSNHYCALTTVDTHNEPEGECRLSYFIDTWGSLEANDVTCIEATKTNGDVITRKCLNGQQMGADPTHTITSEWFYGGEDFKIALNAITQGTYFNGHEIIAHDDVKLTCRPCATAAPTKAPTDAPTKFPTKAPTKACQTTCQLASSGLIEVDHDPSSGHNKHRCFMNEQNDCECECSF